jgi:amidase
MDGLTALDAAGVAALVRDGWTSAVDVARAHLDRIAALDGGTGAFAALDPRRVLAQAECVDARPDRFALPLAGVPVAVEDRIDVAGHPTRHGSAATPDEPARRDDDLVKRLRAAGALIIGKARVPELAAWGAGPVAAGAGPAGPGGGAAAVAAGMAALALGTDGGGALRIAAARCGLVGLKPGPGVVPLPGRLEEHWYGLSAAGPVARTAQDAALLLGVLRAEPVDLDGRGGPSRVALSLRVPTPFGRLHTDHRAAAVGAAARLRAGPDGAAVVIADPPYPARAGPALAAPLAGRRGRGRRGARAGPRPARAAHRGGGAARSAGCGGSPRPGGRRHRVARRGAGLDGRRGLRPAAVARHAGPPPAAAGRGVRRPAAQAGQVPFARAWNLAGLPAAVAPVRIDGRPVGVQLVGRPGSEALLLAAAARWSTGWCPRPAPRRPAATPEPPAAVRQLAGGAQVPSAAKRSSVAVYGARSRPCAASQASSS